MGVEVVEGEFVEASTAQLDRLGPISSPTKSRPARARADAARGKILAIDEILVHADRPVRLAAAANELQREMRLDGLVVDLDHLDERVDGLVWLLVEQEVEPVR